MTASGVVCPNDPKKHLNGVKFQPSLIADLDAAVKEASTTVASVIIAVSSDSTSISKREGLTNG